MDYKEIERSIITKFRKGIWRKFTLAVRTYDLIRENDDVMVCISGGKDSFLLAKCIQELQRHGKIHFNARYVVMNPGYNQRNIDLIHENAKKLNINIEVFESDIFDIVTTIESKSPCYLCARMRRGYLYNKAKELGCNKIVLGHHFDDVIETTLLSMLYGAEIKTMMPKLHSENFPGIDLIRPMYLIEEREILAWKKYCGLNFLNCACKFTLEANNNEELSKRKEMKKLIEEMKKVNPNVKLNIFKSMTNINMNMILGHRKDGVLHSFMEEYED